MAEVARSALGHEIFYDLGELSCGDLTMAMGFQIHASRRGVQVEGLEIALNCMSRQMRMKSCCKRYGSTR